jgi:hypothetical protein
MVMEISKLILKKLKASSYPSILRVCFKKQKIASWVKNLDLLWYVTRTSACGN